MSPQRTFTFGRILTRILVGAFCLLSCACGSVPVAEDVSQTQATEIVATLNQSGIYALASKESGGRGKYTVEVKRSFYSQAVALLHEKGLPGERKPTFNEMVAQNGIIPNSREMDALKLDHALATEIEEMLQNHPGVASARVIVRLNFLKSAQQPAVSVVVQQREGASATSESLAPLITRIVPGVQAENVTVTTVPTLGDREGGATEGVLNDGKRIIRVPLAPFLFFWRVPEDDYGHIVIVFFACLLMIGLVGGIVGYWYGYYQQSKQYFDTTLPEVVQRPGPRYERSRREVRPSDEGGPIQG